MAYIDLNCDLGESYGRWTLGEDEALVKIVSSANVACGFHGGDFQVMDRTVALCKQEGVAVGAQPSYPDLQGFGRRAMQLTPGEIEQMILYQVGALYGFCRAHGVDLAHVKPHGALYNQAAVNEDIALGIARGVARFSRSIPLVGLAGSQAFTRAAAETGLRFVPEAFADRRYNADGTLQTRAAAGSLLTDPAEAAAQAMGITQHEVTSHESTPVAIQAETVCVHADTPGAARIATAVRAALESAGLTIAAF